MESLNLLMVVYERFSVFALIFMRIAAMFWSFNLFRHELITGRLIYSLASIIAVYTMFLNQPTTISYDIFSISMFLNAGLQIFIGFLAGLILNIVFDVFMGVGQIVSTQIGLGLASLIDPRLGSITTLSHFYVITASIIFLFLNGHLFIIKTIINSFTVLPLDKQYIPVSLMHDALSYSSIIFSGSIMLSLTIVLTMLLTNISLAVMTKFAPQFNIFSVGISITLIIGLFCLYLTFTSMTAEGTSMISGNLDYFQHAFQKMK